MDGLVLLERDGAIAAQSRHSVLALKQLYRAQADLPLEAGLAYEIVHTAGIGPDFAERVSGQFGQSLCGLPAWR